MIEGYLHDGAVVFYKDGLTIQIDDSAFLLSNGQRFLLKTEGHVDQQVEVLDSGDMFKSKTPDFVLNALKVGDVVKGSVLNKHAKDGVVIRYKKSGPIHRQYGEWYYGATRYTMADHAEFEVLFLGDNDA